MKIDTRLAQLKKPLTRCQRFWNVLQRMAMFNGGLSTREPTVPIDDAFVS